MIPADGFLRIDKPCGISSFAAVAAIRRELRCAKAGHAGTLDPLASGLLLVAVGLATRLLPFLVLEPKVYRFCVQFGQETDTLDSQGVIIRRDGPIPGQTALADALSGFTGDIRQRPPAYSAIKVSGNRSYRLAREGRPVELPERTVTIGSLSLLEYDETAGQAYFDVSCSGGTYVRSLARDIAAALGTCGYALSIRRQAIGRFSVDTALTIETIAEARHSLLSIREAFGDRRSIVPDERQTRRLATGSAITVDTVPPGNDPLLFAFDANDRLLAVLEKRDGNRFQPLRVFFQEERQDVAPLSGEPA